MEEEVEEDEETEAQGPKVAKAPRKPTQQEVEAHMVTHIPFRSWCEHCVRGKSKGRPHPRNTDSEKTIPTLTIDYMFMHEYQGETEEKGMPVLVTKDVNDGGRGTGMITARVVPRKGAQQYAVKGLASDIAMLGHQELILKSDGEPSIVALKEAAKMERGERIVFEESPVGESKCNGVIENAIQQVQGQFRTVKDALESRIGERLGGDSVLIPWMVIHAARTINRYHVAPDGKTNYERWKGKRFKREVAEFGETVMYLKPGTKGKDKFNSRWEKGVWLGVKDDTGEVIIGTTLGTVKARDFKRLGSNEDRWNKEVVTSVQGTPWEPTPGKADDAIPVRVRLAEEGREQEPPKPIDQGIEREEIKRRARITREDVVRIGFTLNCPGCKAISRNAQAQNHTEACRSRIEEELTKEGGIKAKRVAEGKGRYEEHMAKRQQAGSHGNKAKREKEGEQEEDVRKRQKEDDEQGIKRKDEEGDQEKVTKQQRSEESRGSKREREEGEEHEQEEPPQVSGARRREHGLAVLHRGLREGLFGNQRCL